MRLLGTGPPIEVLVASKKDVGRTRMPSAPNVKLDRKMFSDVWWVCRVIGKTHAELLVELAGVQAAALYKRHEAAIDRLKKLDAEEDQIVRKAQAAD